MLGKQILFATNLNLKLETWIHVSFFSLYFVKLERKGHFLLQQNQSKSLKMFIWIFFLLNLLNKYLIKLFIQKQHEYHLVEIFFQSHQPLYKGHDYITSWKNNIATQNQVQISSHDNIFFPFFIDILIQFFRH